MIREQTHNLRCWGSAATWWLPLMLLTLAILFQPATVLLAAQSGAETAEEQADESADSEAVDTESTEVEKKEAQPADESDSDSKADAEESTEENTEEDTESKAEEKKEEPTDTEGDKKKESDAEAEEATEEKKTDEKEQQPEEEKPADSESTEEAKAMKAKDSADSAPPSAETKPTAESKPDVEADRPQELEPPPAKTKQGKPKVDRPKTSEKKKCIIGATATLLEKQSGLKFRARVDSGAKSCSLHAENITVQNASKKEAVAERMSENIGKVITFEIKNGDGKPRILKRKIASYVIIKNSNKEAGRRRYKVPMTFLWKNMEKEVLVTLTDRSHMEHPLLLGRNFLRGDFLVDVEIDSDDEARR